MSGGGKQEKGEGMRGAEGGLDGGLGQRVGDGRARERSPLLTSLMTFQPLAYVQGVSSGSAVELYRMYSVLWGQVSIAVPQPPSPRSSHLAAARSSAFAFLEQRSCPEGDLVCTWS